MPITTSINTFIARAGGKIETPKLPNDLIINIIKLADGGKTTHKQKMLPVIQSIKQTGGWNNWHKEEGDEAPMEWMLNPMCGGKWYNGNDDVGISWDEVILSNQGKSFWMDELLEAEMCYQL